MSRRVIKSVAPRPRGSLEHYLRQIRYLPVLTADEERVLARRWREHRDLLAARKLITSHLRLVVAIARKYFGYGVPLTDMIAEGNIGLLQGLQRFDPDRGVRFSSYAYWWIRNSILIYVRDGWSLVRIAGTPDRRRLFFTLRTVKTRIGAIENGDLSPTQVTRIARTLLVSERDVIDMNRSLAGKAFGDGAPNPMRRAGDQCDFAYQIIHSRMPAFTA